MPYRCECNPAAVDPRCGVDRYDARVVRAGEPADFTVMI